MTFSPGKYITLEGIEITPEHVLDVNTEFEMVHSRACVIRQGPPTKGSLICILVKEGALVKVHRNGRLTYLYKDGRVWDMAELRRLEESWNG